MRYYFSAEDKLTFSSKRFSTKVDKAVAYSQKNISRKHIVEVIGGGRYEVGGEYNKNSTHIVIQVPNNKGNIVLQVEFI